MSNYRYRFGGIDQIIVTVFGQHRSPDGPRHTQGDHYLFLPHVYLLEEVARSWSRISVIATHPACVGPRHTSILRETYTAAVFDHQRACFLYAFRTLKTCLSSSRSGRHRSPRNPN